MALVRLLWFLIGWHSLSNSSMARIKVMPRKGEDERGQKIKMQAQVHAKARGPPVLVDPQYQKERPLQPKASYQPRVSWRRWLKRQRGWERWGGHQSHHWPDSWPRWLWRSGHLCQVGRSQLGRSSDLLWEARSPRRNSWRLIKWRSSKGTDQGLWLYLRSITFRKV